MPEKPYKKFNITIFGSGNVAWHLAHAFISKNHKINTIIGRNSHTGEELAKDTGALFTSNFQYKTHSSDLIILALNDSCLPEIIEEIQPGKAMIMHTSGSIAMDIFKDKFTNYGVFYPFQTLTKGVEVDLTAIPFCLEANNLDNLTIIHNLASSVSSRVYSLNSDKRRILHLAGVLSNNFMNHLIARAYDLIEKNKIDKELLLPMLKETLKKLEKVSPHEAQTGPARRKNLKVLETHKSMLADEPEMKKLYSLISDSIIAYYS